MTTEQAENSVTVSALVVAGIFAVRKVVEPGIGSAAKLREEGKGGVRAQNLAKDYRSIFGAAPPVEWGQFLKAAGSMYIVMAVLAQISADIGGALAILVGTSVVIGNGVAVINDVQTKPGESQKERLADAQTKLAFEKLRFQELEKTFGRQTAEALITSER